MRYAAMPIFRHTQGCCICHLVVSLSCRCRHVFLSRRGLKNLVCFPHFDGGRRRSIFELLADVALQIRPDSELRLAFSFYLSHSVMQSTKYSRRNDWRSEVLLCHKKSDCRRSPSFIWACSPTKNTQLVSPSVTRCRHLFLPLVT